MAARIIYSTGIGTLCPNCRRAVRDCVCPKGAPGAAQVRRRPRGPRDQRTRRQRRDDDHRVAAAAARDRCARRAAEEALWVGRHGAQRRHRNSGRSSRPDRCGTCQIGLAGEAIRRIAICVYHALHREKSCLESVLFSKDRRRRNRPETLRHMNYSLWRSLESDRAVPFNGAPIHRRGAARIGALDLSGLRTEGRRAPALLGCRPISVYFRSEVAMGLKTPLYDTHVSRGAKIVDFGGWDMPLSFGSQIEEHHAVRRDAGMFDVSHMCIVDLMGARGREFLRFLLANDAAQAGDPPGQALVFVHAAAQRRRDRRFDRLLHDRESWFRTRGQRRYAPQGSRVDTASMRRRFGVAVRERDDLAMIAVQGPNARAKTAPLLSAGAPRGGDADPALQRPPSSTRGFSRGPDTRARTASRSCCRRRRPPTPGRRCSRAGIAAAGLGARDTLRLEAGMNLYGNDMDEEPPPSGVGLGLDGGVRPGGARFHRPRGARASRAGTAVANWWAWCSRIAACCAAISRSARRRVLSRAARDESGEITSGTFSPTLNRSIALARRSGRNRGTGVGRYSRQAACGARREAAVRAPRQGLIDDLVTGDRA